MNQNLIKKCSAYSLLFCLNFGLVTAPLSAAAKKHAAHDAATEIELKKLVSKLSGLNPQKAQLLNVLLDSDLLSNAEKDDLTSKLVSLHVAHPESDDFATRTASLLDSFAVIGDQIITGSTMTYGNAKIVYGLYDTLVSGTLHPNILGGNSENIPNTIVGRDLTGSFSAERIGVSGTINIDLTRSGTAGLILQNNIPFLHGYGANIYLGNNAGNFSSTGGSMQNIGIGKNTLSALTGIISPNIAIGPDTMKSLTTGAENVAVGPSALMMTTTTARAIAIGGGTLIAAIDASNCVAIGSSAGEAMNTGENSVIIGRRAGQQNKYIYESVLIGASASSTSTTGGHARTAVGAQALENAHGDYNTALGYKSLNQLSIGSYNTGIGNSTLGSMTNGNSNTAIGEGAGYSHVQGDYNIYIDNYGLDNPTESNVIRIGRGVHKDTYLTGTVHSFLSEIDKVVTTTATIEGIIELAVTKTATCGTIQQYNVPVFHTYNNNTFLGLLAGNFDMTATASHSIGIGMNALGKVTGGSGNIAIGDDALAAIEDGGGNIAIGVSSMFSGKNLASNIGIGHWTLKNNNSVGNIAVGNFSQWNNTGGDGNVGIGDYTLSTVIDGDYNVGIGGSCLRLTTSASYNVGVGIGALEYNGEGNNNVALGYFALNNNFSGVDNIAVGSSALSSANSAVSRNIGIGTGALLTIAADRNIGIGTYALSTATTGTFNIAIGDEAMNQSKAASQNIAMGTSALREPDDSSYGNIVLGDNNLTTGGAAISRNVIIGHDAVDVSSYAYDNTIIGHGAGPTSAAIMTQNTIIGTEAGSGITTSSINNIFIGQKAGSAENIGSGNICIGHTGGGSEGSIIRLGTTGTHTGCYIAGIRGVTTNNNDAQAVFIDSSGQLGTTSSSRRYKEDIHDMAEASSNLNKLRPVTFNYRSDATKHKQYGLIAEEVAQVLPDIVIYNQDGSAESVQYHVLPVLLLNEYQKQDRKLTRVDNDQKQTTTTLDQLLKRINALEKEIKILKNK